MKLLSLILFSSISASALQNDTKGLLPEVQLTTNNEELNMKKSFSSEVLITKSENKAIETLKKIIKKNKNIKEEPDLLFRLAELYMRRAKSGRFFDLDRTSEYRLKEYGLHNQKAQTALKDALKIYDQIRLKFPNYKELDFVLFNSALANIQIKQTDKAKKLYTQLISNYPKSVLIPDALLELGELYYNQHNFTAALEKFKALEKYQDSRAYHYGLYKSAWCYYNLKDTESGINQLLIVVKQNPPDIKDDKKYNLRREALRDLTLFVGETLAPNKIFSFFNDITTEQELGEIILALAGLYETHSRYKEISVFTQQYIEHYPNSAQAPKCFTKLIETNETLKLRSKVIESLTEMSDFCKRDKADSSCFTEFRRVSLDISKKWWDIWLKNKNNTEFSNLTEKAFKNLLSIENPDSPDSKSRYAFSELLFQQGKYIEASQNYEIVSLYKNLDKTMAHDALYGALYSIEKLLEKKDDSELVEKQKNLALRYLKEFKNGEHVVQTQYKLGYIFYKQSDLNQALKYTMPLLEKHKYPEIKTKAEDLVLDIYNIKKDYVTLQKTAKDILKTNSHNERTVALKKIIEEAQYSQLQIDMKDTAVLKQIDFLNNFAKEHADTKLGQEAKWQSVSLAYSNGYDVLGADLSLAYIKQYPSDNRKIDALKDAAKSYIDAGNLIAAIKTLNELSSIDKTQTNQHTELICDLTKINNQIKDSRDCYKKLLTRISKEKKTALLNKLMQTYEQQDTDTQDYKETQNLILAENIEPLATQILIKKAQKLLEQKNKTEAFNLSMKINARPVSADLRAEARLIQAEILASEFFAQSVRAQESKFSMVLSMKTEKFDKAFTAYSSAIKMSKSEKVQQEALNGIDRLYTHFIESVGNMPIPDTLSAADKNNLRAELGNLVAPFIAKKKSNAEQINTVSKLSISSEKSVVWSDHSIEKSITPKIKYPDSGKLNQYYETEPSFNNIKEFIKKKNYVAAEKAAYELTSTSKNRQIGLYYLSLIADQMKEYDKSLWLLEKAQTQPNSHITNLELINYQKAKVYYSVKDFNSAFKYFEKVLNGKNNFTEASIITGIKHFSDGDYLKVSSEFSRLSAEQIYNYGVDILHIESVLIKDDALAAQKLATQYSAFKADRLDMLLEQARIHESFTFDQEAALNIYQKALKVCNEADLSNWLKRKIEFLKVNKNNQITSNVGGE